MTFMAKDLKSLVGEICAKEGWKHAAEGEGFRIVVPLPGERAQDVLVRTFPHEGETLVRSTTLIGHQKDLDACRCRKALELNATLPYGQLALESEHLVLTETRPLKTAAAETSSTLIKFIARQADFYEKAIFGKDIH